MPKRHTAESHNTDATPDATGGVGRRTLLSHLGAPVAAVAMTGGLAGTVSAQASPPSANGDPDGVVDVRSYGAVGDGNTDDTAAIQAAVRAAVAMRPNVFRPRIDFPTALGYLVTDTITVQDGIDIHMDSPLMYDGPADRPALDIGSLTNNTVARMRLRAVHAPGPGRSDWSNEEAVGIRIRNLYASVIDIAQANGFAIGVQLIGDSSGFVYNEVHLGQIIANKIGVDLTNRNSGDGIGWCNENLFLNGQFQQYSTTNPGEARIGVRITSMDGTYVRNNNNNFYKPCFQLWDSVAEPAEALPILVEHGNMNRFYECRNEANSLTTMRVENISTENVLTVGWGQGTVDDRSERPATEIHTARTILTDTPAGIYHSGPLHKKACYYDGDKSVHIPGIGFGASEDAGVRRAGKLSLTPDYLEIGVEDDAAVGVFLETGVAKRFVLRTDAETGHAGRVHIVCYGAAGEILEDPGTGLADALIGTKASYAMSWQPDMFGGCYRTNEDHAHTYRNDFYFRVADEVKTVRILLWRGTEPLRVRAFSLYALDEGTPAVWSGIDELAGDMNVGVTAPTTGTWARGKTVVNAEPAIVHGRGRAQYIAHGWRKVTDGDSNEPGTDWVEMRAYQSSHIG